MILCRMFRLHDQVNQGTTVGTGAYTVRMSKFEYADDAALIDEEGREEIFIWQSIHKFVVFTIQ